MDSKTKTFLRTLMRIVAVGVLVGLLFWIALPPLLEAGIERYLVSLAARLQVTMEVSHVEAGLHDRRIRLYGLRVGQPAGFENGPLFYAAEIESRIHLSSFLRADQPRGVSLAVDRARLNVRTGTNGVSNLGVLADRLRKQPPAAEDLEERTAGGPGVELRSVRLTNCAVHYREDIAAENDIDFELADMDLTAEDLRLGGAGHNRVSSPANLRATGVVRKPLLPDGRWGVAARLGPVGAGTPSFQCAVQWVGLELGALQGWLPTGTAAVLGGDSVDVAVRVRGAPDFVAGNVTMETIGGYAYEATISSGTNGLAIQTDADAMVFLLRRSRGGLGNVFSRTYGAGKGAVEGAARAASELTKGAVKTAGSFGAGILDAAKGVVTLDGSDIRAGVGQMGHALSGGAKDAVVTVGGELMEGAGKVSGSLTGQERERAWRRNVPQRWDAAWGDARAWLERQPFPPRLPAADTRTEAGEAVRETTAPAQG